MRAGRIFSSAYLHVPLPGRLIKFVHKRKAEDLKLIRGVCEDGFVQVAVEKCQFRFMTSSTQMVGSFRKLLTVCAKEEKKKKI